MDAIDVLRSGTDVGITMTSEWGTQTVASRIVHAADRALYLTTPGPKDPRTMLTPGQLVALYIKPGSELYVATTQVLGFTRRGPVRVVVARPGALERVEHRQSTRAPVLIHPEQCEAYFGQSTGWLAISPTIINIGVGGIMLRHHRLLVEDTTVKMQFRLPDGYGPIYVEGRVRHSQVGRRTDQPTYSMGVMFTRIAVEDSAAILHYVSRVACSSGRQTTIVES